MWVLKRFARCHIKQVKGASEVFSFTEKPETPQNEERGSRPPEGGPRPRSGPGGWVRSAGGTGKW